MEYQENNQHDGSEALLKMVTLLKQAKAPGLYAIVQVYLPLCSGCSKPLKDTSIERFVTLVTAERGMEVSQLLEKALISGPYEICCKSSVKDVMISKTKFIYVQIIRAMEKGEKIDVPVVLTPLIHFETEESVDKIGLAENRNMVGYELVSILCHVGNKTTQGHFFVLQWVDDAKKWLKLDDLSVTEVEPETLTRKARIEACFLVYRKKLIETEDKTGPALKYTEPINCEKCIRYQKKQEELELEIHELSEKIQRLTLD
ncbi:uncharacterized protein LOC132193410 [Neocloeon triangulifer]|uniref:uncharacterized protein LOC132193410 n=1 Tax=Neocloeon triangulifer TaxID=2078957 RepID=UPI00286F06B0|nr:uncharacterized protein LOC132193410 [Neocloeon triangulifer]XP_059470039.1 uncharacterized protein LOC132193410 [Neocloeon triangulifer]XP_059470040.1 uncharacterized protein LOC132193410 [Neocloeon triangulifer]XP_059470041.1 uncharacterized protein LOC132193410 [Neocloeon triangulifer]